MTESWHLNMAMIVYLFVCGSCEEVQMLNWKVSKTSLSHLLHTVCQTGFFLLCLEIQELFSPWSRRAKLEPKHCGVSLQPLHRPSYLTGSTLQPRPEGSLELWKRKKKQQKNLVTGQVHMYRKQWLTVLYMKGLTCSLYGQEVQRHRERNIKSPESPFMHTAQIDVNHLYTF